MTSFSIQSFGCRVNQAEAFVWADEFQKHGLSFEADNFKSDIILVNTCTLTRRADRDVLNFLRKASRLNPEARLVVTGCFVERAAEELREFPQVWRVLPNEQKENLPRKVLGLVGPKRLDATAFYRSRALIKIQDGCNLACSFCVIPQVRGKNASADPDKILGLVEDYANRAFREVVLTGIHICLYGRDLRPRTSLLDLLLRLEKVKGMERIRLSSLDPRFMDRSLLEFLASSEKICPHFHFSLQHGSAEVLKRMGRHVQVSRYDDILSYLNQQRPDASLGADLIVGFPEESEEDFEKMSRFLRESPLTYFHVFPYSRRPGTAAAERPQVGDRLKSDRAHKLRMLSQEKNWDFRLSQVGKEWDAVVIKKRKDDTKVLTANYLDVFIPAAPVNEKDRVRVLITRATEKKTFGRVLPIEEK